MTTTPAADTVIDGDAIRTFNGQYGSRATGLPS